MTIHDSPWQSMAVHDNLWQSMTIHDNPWQSMTIHNSPWQSMTVHDSLWKSIIVHGNPWQSMIVHVCQIAPISHFWLVEENSCVIKNVVWPIKKWLFMYNYNSIQRGHPSIIKWQCVQIYEIDMNSWIFLCILSVCLFKLCFCADWYEQCSHSWSFLANDECLSCICLSKLYPYCVL